MTPREIAELERAEKDGLIELTVLGPDSYVAHLVRPISPEEWDDLMKEDRE